MTYGFIGSGKMASALVQGAIASKALAPADLLLTDCHHASAEKLATETGARFLPTNAEVAGASDVIVLCVKPGDALAALSGMSAALAGKTLISIVAGLPLAALEQAAGAGCRVVRVMPNTPALIRQGVSAYALGSGAGEAEARATETLFGGVGEIHRLPEKLLDAVTGLSGSGPAYVYLAIEALADGGVLMGLPRALALRLAAGTVAGAALMVQGGGEHPALLREAVTSPGGTTAAGLEALEAGGVRAAFLAAVRAATERAQELGR